MMTDRQLVLPLLLCLVPVAAIRAQAPVTLQVYPERLTLESPRDRQGLIVQQQARDGTVVDVTDRAEIKVQRTDLVKVNAGILVPVSDGTSVLEVRLGEQVVSVPLKVQNAQTKHPLSFRLDVMPVLTKASCNSGKCHGAASGKDGFRLSLFGFDPAGDHYRLTRELPNRRLNLARPDECLLIQKSLGTVPHTGGKLFDRDSEMHAVLRDWIRAGAPNDPVDVAQPTGIRVVPGEIILGDAAPRHRLLVQANYSDGTDRDVTRFCQFMSNNDNLVVVNDLGEVTAKGVGETSVIARFATFTENCRVMVRPSRGDFAFPEVPEANYIDRLVHLKLRKLRLIPSGGCDDATFLRRVFLDLLGVLPTPEETRIFLADQDPEKRNKCIDRLLERPEFEDLWVMKLAEMLQIRSINGASDKAIRLYAEWLRDQVRQGTPINQIVHNVIAASGGTFHQPTTNYYQTETSPTVLAENVAQVFLGMRIQCAQCHNHPFDRWTMDDYYGFAAFFAQVGYKQASDPRELTIYNKAEGEITHPVHQESVTPKFLGGDVPRIGQRDRRVVLADWLTAKDNPFFARNLANRIWAHFLGRGIVDPVDDVRVSNPPTNPELLDALAEHLVEYQFDLKQLARDICRSHTYQRSVKTNPTNLLDDRNFSHAQIRRVQAEVLLDCLSQATNAPTRFPGQPENTRAVHLYDARVSNYFLTTFGRGTRQTPCACEVKVEPNLSQALHLINGKTIQAKIRDGAFVEQQLKDGKTPLQVAEELYLRCFSRSPTDKERTQISSLLQGTEAPAEELEDLFWAMLNSKEFLFNH